MTSIELERPGRLTAEQRARIRAAIDRRQRALVPSARACGSCGGDLDGCTVGCSACRKRQRRRERREAEERIRGALGPLVGIDADEQVYVILSGIRFPSDPPGRKPCSGPLPRPAC